MDFHSAITDDLAAINREFDVREKYFEKRKRRHRVTFFVSIFIWLVFYASASARNDRILELIPFPDEFSNAISFIVFLFSMGFALYYYVQGEPFWDFWNKKKERQTEADYLTRDIPDRIGMIESEIYSLSEKIKVLDYTNRETLISTTVEDIKKKAHEEIWDELTDQSLKIAQIKLALAPIEEAYTSARARLLSEVAALGRRGTANLVFGVLTTIAALGILSNMALNTIDPEAYRLVIPNGQLDLGLLTLMFVPKLSLAIFVQVFSLFFLRLYKAGFAEIKYFQNELTNLEVKYLGVVSAVLADDEEAVREASKSLLAVERNHVLSKGQTTIELEKYKIESRSSSEILKLLPKFFGQKNP
ncbi:hypothetical protein NF673_14940 [Pseudomonas moraviensis]|uniref:hypothetical protein n=1 Tax=Pseudomonas moraviensis TaxID=321662 RepID=UPI0020934CB3|nr:hypothetical protein [Pseudomonas moraviensis]UST61940.1 hypothetical protein NF673_14940 [Pseudomonas moraviensis]